VGGGRRKGVVEVLNGEKTRERRQEKAREREKGIGGEEMGTHNGEMRGGRGVGSRARGKEKVV